MPSSRLKSHLCDIGNAIVAIEMFVEGMDLKAYEEDARTQAAVERKLLIVSEAAIRLGDGAEILCPGIPWKDIRGIGNWLRHQYDHIDSKMVWNTVTDDLPALKSAVTKALDRLGTAAE